MNLPKVIDPEPWDASRDRGEPPPEARLLARKAYKAHLAAEFLRFEV